MRDERGARHVPKPRLLLAAVALLLPRPAVPQGLTHLLTAPQDGTVLGEIGDVDLGPDGHVLALDTQADVVYVFSRDGVLVRRLGSKGRGPGEILLSTEVEVGPGGDVMIVDSRNRRLTLWSGTGTLMGSARFDSLFGSRPLWPHDLVWTRAGVFLKTSQFTPDRPIDVYAVPSDLRGRGTRLVSIPPGDASPMCTFCAITVDDSGRLVATVGDTVYAVLALDGDGAMTARWGRADLPAVRRTDEEIERLNARTRRLAGVEGARTGRAGAPAYKTRFGSHSIGVDGDGRLWAAPRVAAGAAGFFDVFSPDGQLLRTIRLDVPVTGFRIRGDRLVIASETAGGEPVVRVYVIDPR